MKYSPTFSVVIQQSDIDRAKFAAESRKNQDPIFWYSDGLLLPSNTCPIAQALKRVTGDIWSVASIAYSPNEFIHVYNVASDAIRNVERVFDRGGDVSSFLGYVVNFTLQEN